MMRISVKAQLACIAFALAAPLYGQTGTWTSPVVLSSGGQGWEAAAAIDGNGNSAALWDERTTQDHLWSRSKASGGNWGAVTKVSPALQTTSVLPAVRISTAGFATAVWSDQSGVWTADRPPTSNWSTPELLIAGASSPIFVMNARGDAAISWTVGGGPRASSGSVMAVVRLAAGAWTAPETVASGVHLSGGHAGIAANGAVIVTWESYTAVCQRYGCALSSYVLHAARQNAGSSEWVDSGALLGPDRTAHAARVALDAAGEAILMALSNSGAYTSTIQRSSGGGWSPFKTIVNPQTSTIVSDLASDDAGQVILVYESIAYPTSEALAVSGTISNNVWSSPVVLSGSDTSVGQVYFALAPNGAALAIWLSSGGTPAIHAITRGSAMGAWSRPITVSGPGTYISPEAVAVNSSGDAIAIYSGYDTASVHTEYAITYQP